MRPTREKAVGAARWLGLGRRTALAEEEVVVISPHLDDGIFSLGAAVSYASRRRAKVTILTVFAGDPGHSAPAGDWDRKAGFETAGEAAVARRAEDARACALVGAHPVWLPFSDLQYGRGGSDEAIRAAVTAVVGTATVLLPGFPLMNPDHLWLNRLLREAFPPERTGFYAEQPYSALWSERPGDDLGAASFEHIPPPASWQPLRAGLRDQRRKAAACRAYETQLPLLGPVVGTIFRYEMRLGGESLSWASARP
jgi:LmbE family N-acetylglucosaminyl deacetylase